MNKNLIRVLVLAAVFAYPGVETYRYYCAKQALALSQKQLRMVTLKYAQVRSQHESPVMKTSLKVGE